MARIFLSSIFFFTLVFTKPLYRSDDASEISINKRLVNSHINVFIPNMPYIYLSKLINGTLIRASDNARGWEFMLATHLKREGALVYIFTLRKDIKFQDGTNFTADDIISNFKFAIKPNNIVYISKAEKLSDYKVKFTLREPNETFLYILARYNIYSKAYLKKFDWGFNLNYTASNMKEAGPYGLGPYILVKGFATGRKQTSIINLRANPYYFEKGMPYIENITIYTELSTKQALDMSLKEEKLDITPIPFNKKVDALISPYTKLMTSPSVNSISIVMNMMRKNSILKDKKIRLALNAAINQENLLKFIYKGEGNIGPTTSNINYYSINLATKGMLTHHKRFFKKNLRPKKNLKSILNGLELNVVTMEQMMFLWKGIEFQLMQYGVKLNFNITNSEKKLFEQLLTNRDSPKNWDLLSWADDSWSSNNPWSVLFHYNLKEPWSAIDKDEKLQKYVDEFLESRFNSSQFISITEKIIKYVYDKAYMLVVPSPNIVLAVNKEVDYHPSKILLMPLWKTKITPYHWSIRTKKYPENRKRPIRPKRLKIETNKN